MRISEENRRRNGHVLVWDQPELSLDDKNEKKNKSKKWLLFICIFFFSNFGLISVFFPFDLIWILNNVLKCFIWPSFKNVCTLKWTSLFIEFRFEMMLVKRIVIIHFLSHEIFTYVTIVVYVGIYYMQQILKIHNNLLIEWMLNCGYVENVPKVIYSLRARKRRKYVQIFLVLYTFERCKIV